VMLIAVPWMVAPRMSWSARQRNISGGSGHR
jgi:hypothetical protein